MRVAASTVLCVLLYHCGVIVSVHVLAVVLQSQRLQPITQPPADV